MATPTFTLPRQARPWKACSTDTTRPVLNHGYLHRRGDDLWLVTTDSYIACAIKIDSDAREGHVHADVLRHAHKGHRIAQHGGAMSWRVDLPDGHRLFDLSPLLGEAPPPLAVDALAAFGLWEPLPEKSTSKIEFNPRLTPRLLTAMGIPDSFGVAVTFHGPLKPLRITAPSFTDCIGLQMPMRLDP